jgi:hypothetical protein
MRRHNNTDHILIEGRWHWGILEVQIFMGADCDTDHYMVVLKVREGLAIINKKHNSVMWKNSISGS